MKTPSSHFPIHTEKAPSPIPGPVLFPFFSTFFLRKKKVAKKNGYSCCRLSAGLQRPAPTDPSPSRLPLGARKRHRHLSACALVLFTFGLDLVQFPVFGFSGCCLQSMVCGPTAFLALCLPFFAFYLRELAPVPFQSLGQIRPA